MADSLETAGVKLVTVIAPCTIGDELLSDLRQIGVSGYTTEQVKGWGKHGTRQFGLNEEPNIRIDTLVSAELARVILARIEARSAESGMIAFVQDAEAVPRHHFL